MHNKHAIAAMLRGTRNGSIRQRKASTGIANATERPTVQARPGMMDSRNEKLATSMIKRSTKVAVIKRTSCLNCDSRIRTTMTASESAPDVSGRRSKVSQMKLSSPQVRAKAARAAGSDSNQIHIAKAAKWMAARRASAGRQPAAARRVVRLSTAGGMTHARRPRLPFAGAQPVIFL